MAISASFFRNWLFFAAADLIKASLRSLCNYLHFIPVLFVSFLTFPPLYYYLPRGWHILKLNQRCLVWIQVQIGKDVGQNLQSKSHSKNRNYWVMQLPKEGPFPKLALKSVCTSAASNRWVIIHSEWLFSCQGKGGKKNPLCFIHSVVCLARFTFAKYLSCEIPSDVFSYTAVTKESWGTFGLFSRQSIQVSEEWVILLCRWMVASFGEMDQNEDWK